jgi:hypothetical protein
MEKYRLYFYWCCGLSYICYYVSFTWITLLTFYFYPNSIVERETTTETIMSAYMVSDEQISAVLDTAIAMKLIAPRDFKRIGQNIVNANVKSLVARYGKRELSNKRKFGYIVTKDISKVQGHKYAHCIMYQCSEYNTWKKSKAYKFLMLLCAKIEATYGMTYKEVSTKLWEGLNWGYRA